MSVTKVDVVILGAGTAGLTALNQVRKQTDRFLLVEPHTLGTTCARNGCMPSKVLIQIAQDYHRRRVFATEGILGAENLNLDPTKVFTHVRTLRDRFVRSVVEDLKEIRSKILEQKAYFLEPNVLQIGKERVETKATIIATGSHPVMPEAWKNISKNVITTDDIFELERLPRSLAVIGLGPAGLELGQALAYLGVVVTGFQKERQKLASLTDPTLIAWGLQEMAKHFPIYSGHEAKLSPSRGHDDWVTTTSGETTFDSEYALVSVGRKPNLNDLCLEKIGIERDGDGRPRYHSGTMQIGTHPIFIAGEANDHAHALHEVADEGRIAGYNAVNPLKIHDRFINLGIVFTDPNIAQIGRSYRDLERHPFTVREANFDFGRSIIKGTNGKIRIYCDSETDEILGCEMMAPAGEHLAHTFAAYIHQRLCARDLLKMPFYHPVLEETVKAAILSEPKNP